MFGSNKSTEESKTTPLASGNALNALAKGTEAEGTMRCESDLRVDGTLKGKLFCKAKLIIGPTGVIEGEVQCQNAVVEGRFKGILKVTDLLHVRETADVEGDISTNKLTVQNGARFNVSCAMETGATKTPDLKTAGQDATKIAGGKT
jgi:cytoskeletal protein CcmA (bactofilin family)